MSNNPFVTVVTAENFPQEVITLSASVPILVDFWADWCAPCKMLMPVLDKIALEYDGKIRVAKVDTEADPELATTHAIRSLPTVKVFRHGVAVDEFMGALPEQAVREVVERHIERPADAQIAQAQTLAADGDSAGAATLLAEALENDSGYVRLRLALAGYQLDSGDPQKASTTLREIPLAAEQEPQIKRLRARIDLALRTGADCDPTELAKTVERNPDDLTARTLLAECLIQQGEQMETAMSELLEVIRRGRGDDTADRARQTLVQIFASLGAEDERVGHYRRLLAQALN